MQNNTPHISVISPVYKAENTVEELVKQVRKSLETITQNYEIILINDASPDASWQKIAKTCQTDKRVKGINLSRNFGQHYAITAGLNYAKGEWVVVMDCDLQDRPDEIPNLYKKAQEGWDIVFAKRQNRQDKFLKKLSSKVFYLLYSYLSGVKTDSSIANFGIFKQKVITEFNKMPEKSRAFQLLMKYVGFKRTAINVLHAERQDGSSTYSFKKLFRLTLDVMLSNSNKPLTLTVKLGFFISLLAFILAMYNVIARLIGIISVQGYTTTVFSIWFVGGLNLFVLGIIGLYVGKIFDEAKSRQLFIVSEKINF